MNSIIIVAMIQGGITLAGIFFTWFLSDKKLTKVHTEMNGMKDALVKKSGELGEAKGKAIGMAEKQGEIDQMNKDSIPNRD